MQFDFCNLRGIMNRIFYRKDGFTLIELAIVLSLITILTAVTAPFLRNFATSRNLKSSASEIYSLLTYARDVSITENTNYLVLFDLDEQRYWLTSSDNFDLENMSASLVTSGSSTNSNSGTSTSNSGTSMTNSETSTTSSEEEPYVSRTSNLLGIPQKPKTNIKIAMMSVAHGSSQTSQVTTGTDYVCFTPAGTSEEATIYLRDPTNGKGMSISVNQATGYVRIEKTTDAEMNELGLSPEGNQNGKN